MISLLEWLNIDKSDVFIALPGGVGTLNEILKQQ